jgi:hypothetical protein
MQIRRVVAGLHVVLALAHVYWATGATWPARDEREMSRAVLGMVLDFSPQVVLPLAAFHLVIAWCVLRVDRSRLSRLVVAGVALGATARALLGVVWVFTSDAGPAFFWLNLLAYTPACVLLALADLHLVRASASPTSTHRVETILR